ncbi:MAG: thiol oxidoreductase [Myxococcales bacterium]|nr:thiol oxidoreductase [Myxococcales bacterium]
MLLASGCDALLSGAPPDDQILDGPIDGLTSAQLRTFFAGDEAFGELFAPATGLGPVFNQPSCASCHPGDGRGHPATNLTRFGRGDDRSSIGFDYLRGLGGPQLQDHAIPGYPPERLPAEATGISVRGAPIVVGLGLIEAIPEAAILARADPADADGDGIRGQPSYVIPPSFFAPGSEHRAVDGKILGRFGRKATTVNLLHQTAAAYLNDMGITSDFEPADVVNPLVGGFTGDGVADPEVARSTLESVVFYLQTLRPPVRRGAGDPRVVRGEQLFADVGCAACHVPELTTGPSPIAALSERPVRLYSDLLLHDMGPALADHFPEGAADGRQWRTTPLWGLGVIGNLLGGTPYYLHEGRTSSLRVAIELHDGEAAGARDRFAALPPTEREALLAFLRSL